MQEGFSWINCFARSVVLLLMLNLAIFGIINSINVACVNVNSQLPRNGAPLCDCSLWDSVEFSVEKIAKLFGVSTVAVLKWSKSKADKIDPLSSKAESDIVMLDELRLFYE
jgi:hypothetical protein